MGHCGVGCRGQREAQLCTYIRTTLLWTAWMQVFKTVGHNDTVQFAPPCCRFAMAYVTWPHSASRLGPCVTMRTTPGVMGRRSPHCHCGCHIAVGIRGCYATAGTATSEWLCHARVAVLLESIAALARGMALHRFFPSFVLAALLIHGYLLSSVARCSPVHPAPAPPACDAAIHPGSRP